MAGVVVGLLEEAMGREGPTRLREESGRGEVNPI